MRSPGTMTVWVVEVVVRVVRAAWEVLEEVAAASEVRVEALAVMAVGVADAAAVVVRAARGSLRRMVMHRLAWRSQCREWKVSR